MKKWSFILGFFAVAALATVEKSPDLLAKSANVPASAPEKAIQEQLIEPLQKKEAKRPRFSRAAPPPSARRIRILETTPETDAKGRPFLAFAIDESRSAVAKLDPDSADADWRKDAITGCLYPNSKEIWVKLGETYYASNVLLGSSATATADGVCTSR